MKIANNNLNIFVLNVSCENKEHTFKQVRSIITWPSGAPSRHGIPKLPSLAVVVYLFDEFGVTIVQTPLVEGAKFDQGTW